ncbi:MAG TPA: potassium transporter Kup [Microvirga sp.]|jgi:KUP system potassium uptake protein|nr:potassium transporter Kup [Microvirga sp.]
MASSDISSTLASNDTDAGPSGHGRSGFWALTIGSIGVVYGDIGTSPLYAFREAVVAAAGSGEVTRDIVLGILSLLVWTMILVVTVKYVVVLLQADNNGEGGTLSLLALAFRALGRGRGVALALGLIGAGLFYGDAIITPAISVLSAVEGLKLVAPELGVYVVPITIAILISLFAIQSRGTGRVAIFFGPVVTVWFLTLGAIGLLHIADDPSVLAAVSPVHGLMVLIDHPGVALAIMGGVALVATGAEALYADLGHFGRMPIRAAWFGLVFPALLLNYFGQGALVLTNPSAIESPFYRLVPEGLTLPLVVLSTLATIIASQAVITGAFSLTRQAVQLGLFPRMNIRFTSETHQGQIYLPRVNYILLAGVIALVLSFGSSTALAHAYGVSVYGAMVIDGILAVIVIWKGWRWGLNAALAVMLPLVLIELSFFGANLTKLFTGGYVPMLIAAVLILVMWTWQRGTRILFEKTRKVDVPLRDLVTMLENSPPHRVKGTAIFLTSDPETAPAALLHNLKHNKVLHERNVVLTIKSIDVPRVPEEDRVEIRHLGDSFWLVGMTYGYMETPNVPRGLATLRKQGFKFDIMSTSFFLSRRSIRASAHSGMPLWQDKLFISLGKGATDATDFFQIPTSRVVEVGTQVTV